MKIEITDAMVAKMLEYGFDPVLDGKTPGISHYIIATAAIEDVLKLAFPDAEIVETCSLAGAVHIWQNIKVAD